MKELVISKLEAGQRFDKYLTKCLPKAGKSFLYKMLRKKNITLNGKKADGSEKVAAGDTVRIFFSDETFARFSGQTAANSEPAAMQEIAVMQKAAGNQIKVLYEDADILMVDKPVGMLSQKAKKEDVSLVEYIQSYLVSSGYLTPDAAGTFRVGICNRLDRNTSGIVVAGKTVLGLQCMTKAFRERTLKKYYLCLVHGRVDERTRISAFLHKDARTNKVTVYAGTDAEKKLPSDAQPIETEYIPVSTNGKVTLLKVHLITGRTHQIRAHLASVRHPLIGDGKYGNAAINQKYRQQYGVSSQLLHAYELVLEPAALCMLPETAAAQNGLTVRAAVPAAFMKVIEGEDLWQPGIPEVLEALH